MKEALRRQFTNRKHLSEQIDLIDKAIALSKRDIDDLEAIRELGQGWVAEETLAIAIYCSLKYSDDFDKQLSLLLTIVVIAILQAVTGNI